MALTLDVASGESGGRNLLPEVGFRGCAGASLVQTARLLLLLAQLGRLQPLYGCKLRRLDLQSPKATV